MTGVLVGTGTVRSLWVYPVKGLSPQRLDRISVTSGHGVPGDRMWALSRANGLYRPGTREPLPKAEFHMLARDERLAGVCTEITDEHIMTVSVQGHEVLRVDLDDEAGRMDASRFFGRMLGLTSDRMPVIAREPDRRFTDVSVVSDSMMHAISLINLASVRDLEERSGLSIDPLRFRANIYYDGLPPFSELALVGRPVTIGNVEFEAVLNTRRCAATEVNPVDARRDIPVPRLLMEHYGHSEIGVYVESRSAGTVTAGDIITYATGSTDG